MRGDFIVQCVWVFVLSVLVYCSYFCSFFPHCHYRGCCCCIPPSICPTIPVTWESRAFGQLFPIATNTKGRRSLLTCQYFAEHLSTQLFSPTLRSPSLYLVSMHLEKHADVILPASKGKARRRRTSAKVALNDLLRFTLTYWKDRHGIPSRAVPCRKLWLSLPATCFRSRSSSLTTRRRRRNDVKNESGAVQCGISSACVRPKSLSPCELQ